MTKREFTAIERVVQMYAYDESRHFEESGKPDHHIFNDLMVLANLLRKRDRAKGVLADKYQLQLPALLRNLLE